MHYYLLFVIKVIVCTLAIKGNTQRKNILVNFKGRVVVAVNIALLNTAGAYIHHNRRHLCGNCGKVLCSPLDWAQNRFHTYFFGGFCADCGYCRVTKQRSNAVCADRPSNPISSVCAAVILRAALYELFQNQSFISAAE